MRRVKTDVDVEARSPAVRERKPRPEPLGGPLNRLWAAAIASNLADGLARIGVPLIAVTITRDPLAIAVLSALSVVPWLAFGILSGVVVDRIDRRRAMAVANAMRLAAAAVVVTGVVSDSVTLPLLGVAVFVFGAGETLFDNATNAILPAVVARPHLDRANGRIQAAQVSVDMFIATPIAGVLFAAAAVLPMLIAGGAYGVAAVLALALPAAAARARRTSAALAAAEATGEPAATHPKATAGEGIRFLIGHPYLRAMVLISSLEAGFLTFAQANTILLFLDRHGVPEAAIGVLTAGIGVGGLVGSIVAPSLVARFGRGRTMLGGSLAGALGLVAVGAAPNAWSAIALYAVGAAGITVWNVPWATVRQSIIPEHMLGRVIGTARTVTWFLIPIATVLGGLLGRTSLSMSFLVGGGACLVIAIAGARLILRADAEVAAADAQRTLTD